MRRIADRPREHELPSGALVAMARRAAAWWRAELAAGTLAIDARTVEYLIRDLEQAGGLR